jgi:hypothetical protein
VSRATDVPWSRKRNQRPIPESSIRCAYSLMPFLLSRSAARC